MLRTAWVEAGVGGMGRRGRGRKRGVGMGEEERQSPDRTDGRKPIGRETDIQTEGHAGRLWWDSS